MSCCYAHLDFYASPSFLDENNSYIHLYKHVSIINNNNTVNLETFMVKKILWLSQTTKIKYKINFTVGYSVDIPCRYCQTMEIFTQNNLTRKFYDKNICIYGTVLTTIALWSGVGHTKFPFS